MSTYTPVTASQAFTGSNGDAIGANWTQLRDTSYGSTARIFGNKLGGHFAIPANDTTSQAHAVLYRWAGTGTPSADQYAQCVISNFGSAGTAPFQRGGLGVRLDTGLNAATVGYIAYMCDHTVGSTAVVILKLSGSAYDGTVVDSRTFTINVGDTIRFDVIGTSLTFTNVTTAASYSVTDASIATGQPGLYLCSDESGGTLSGPALDDWIAGDVTSAAAGTPSSDVTVSGWTSSAGGSLYATIDEASFDDADYIVSPTISVSTAPAIFGIGSLAAGNWSIGIRAKTSTGTATMRVYLLNDSNVSQGVSSDQTITSTFTTYSLPVTTTGTATRCKVEIVT